MKKILVATIFPNFSWQADPHALSRFSADATLRPKSMIVLGEIWPMEIHRPHLPRRESKGTATLFTLSD